MLPFANPQASARYAKRMKTLVEEENKDRKIIYDEIAKPINYPLRKTMLIQSAYETYRNTDAKGIYYRENVWHKRF